MLNVLCDFDRKDFNFHSNDEKIINNYVFTNLVSHLEEVNDSRTSEENWILAKELEEKHLCCHVINRSEFLPT